MTDIPQEAISRMVELVRLIADPSRIDVRAYVEARAIVALLPEPVDPDLIEARSIAYPLIDGVWASVKGGAFDDEKAIQITLEAIKRGRALAAAERL